MPETWPGTARAPPNKWAVSNYSEQAGPEHGAPSQGHVLLFSFLQTQCLAYLFDYIDKQEGYAKYFTAALFRAQLQGGGAQALLQVASKAGPHAMKLHCPPVVAWARGGVLACWDPTAREDGGCMGQQQICLKKGRAKHMRGSCSLRFYFSFLISYLHRFFEVCSHIFALCKWKRATQHTKVLTLNGCSNPLLQPTELTSS